MNDRFRFRAKRLDNNKFVYGYLCFIYIDNEKHCRIYSPDDVKSYDCYTKTLGQNTGLKDANGNLIYEGDIVKRHSKYSEEEKDVILQAEWDGEDGRYITTDKKHESWFFSMFGYEYEVIGNTHENPELLEDKEYGKRD